MIKMMKNAFGPSLIDISMYRISTGTQSIGISKNRIPGGRNASFFDPDYKLFGPVYIPAAPQAI